MYSVFVRGLMQKVSWINKTRLAHTCYGFMMIAPYSSHVSVHMNS